MRKLQVVIITVLLMMGSTGVVSAQSFLQGLANKAKDKAKEKIEQKVEESVDKTMDKVLNGNKSNNQNQNQNGQQNQQNAKQNAPKEQDAPEAAGEQVKSDFVPGSVVIFEDNVKGEQIGEFPSKWNLIEGNCEVSKLGGETVISLPPATSTDEDNPSKIQPLMKNIYNYLPEEYTLEFDWYVYASQDDCNEIQLYGVKEGYDYSSILN